jgi:hypothetical protein
MERLEACCNVWFALGIVIAPFWIPSALAALAVVLHPTLPAIDLRYSNGYLSGRRALILAEFWDWQIRPVSQTRRELLPYALLST